MSTIKVSNLQNASAASPAIVLDANSRATLNGLSYPTEGSLSGRNRIINGDMRIDQRNAGASVTPASGAYTIDRWGVLVSQTSKLSVQQNAGSVTPPAGFKNYLGVTSLSAYSVGAGDFFSIYQTIEGYNIADFDWGSAGAKTITLSFWVRSSLTGTFSGVASNQYTTAGRYYPFSYTINAANTWEQKTITIAGDTTGTWGSTNGNGIVLQFSLGVGSTYAATAGSWTGTYVFGATGTTSVVGTNGATFYITGVQLEAGSVATPLERRSYGQELALCQRYYWRNAPGVSNVDVALGITAGTTSGRMYIPYPIIMRSAPTFTISNLVMDDEQSATYTTTFSSASAGQQSARLYFSSTGMTAGRPVRLGTSTAAGYIDASAEL